MINLYRQPKPGEFFVVFGDCAQGGADANYVQFLSKDAIDVPLTLKMQGVASAMTPVLHQTLEWLFDKTGVQPVIALERNMGGSSEMERLRLLNRQDKYRIYIMHTNGTIDGDKESQLLGWSTDTASRPRMVGDLKEAIDNRQIIIYDEDTISQLSTFIVNKQNKPVAASNTHDDAVMSLAGAWQLYQTENKIKIEDEDDQTSGNLSSLWGKR